MQIREWGSGRAPAFCPWVGVSAILVSLTRACQGLKIDSPEAPSSGCRQEIPAGRVRVLLSRDRCRIGSARSAA